MVHTHLHHILTSCCSLDFKTISARLLMCISKSPLFLKSLHLIMRLPRNSLPSSLAITPPVVFLSICPFLPSDPHGSLWCFQGFFLILLPCLKQFHSLLTASILMTPLSWPSLDTSTWTQASQANRTQMELTVITQSVLSPGLPISKARSLTLLCL